ncbi:MAG: hypothetical protein ACJAV4_001100 [Pontimonas sp.]|jgi:hypothetical protein
MGAVLIVSSVAGAYVVLEGRSETQSVVIAAKDLMVGDTVSTEDISLASVPPTEALGVYLTSPEWGGTEGLVLKRPIRRGELFTRADFGEPTRSDDSIVTITLTIGTPAWLRAGRVVQLWVAPPAPENSFSAPFVLSPEVIIDQVTPEEGFAADGASSRIDLRIPARDVPGVVHALANAYFLHLTPRTIL